MGICIDHGTILTKGGDIVSTGEYLKKQRVKAGGFKFSLGKKSDKTRIIICNKTRLIWKNLKGL
jgi:hypothetical protein